MRAPVSVLCLLVLAACGKATAPPDPVSATREVLARPLGLTPSQLDEVLARLQEHNPTVAREEIYSRLLTRKALGGAVDPDAVGRELAAEAETGGAWAAQKAKRQQFQARYDRWSERYNAFWDGRSPFAGLTPEEEQERAALAAEESALQTEREALRRTADAIVERGYGRVR